MINNILLKYLLVFFVSMVPLIELRGSVPIGLSPFLGDTLPIIPLYAVCILGNMLPIPVIFFFARKVLIWGADKKFVGKFFTFCLEKGEKGGQKLQEKTQFEFCTFKIVRRYTKTCKRRFYINR